MEKSHLNRWLTSLIILPLLIILILKGGAFLFCLFITTVSMVSFYEWNKIVQANLDKSLKNLRLLPFFLIPFVIFSASGSINIHILTVFLCLAVIFFISIKSFNETKEHFFESALNITGFLYTNVFLSFAVRIKLENNGIKGIFFLLAMVFASDVGAYYSGRKFGKTKLMPKVSPQKTLEGFFGGFFLSVFVSIIFKFLFFDSLDFFNALLCGIFAGILVPIGDLFESMAKRVYKIKDSGTILPGHGGILDRIDGLLLAVPVIYILLNL